MADPVQQPQAPAPGTPEHAAAMAGKFDGAQQKPAAEPDLLKGQPQRPEGLPEKFQDVGSLAKAYAELEKKLGGQQPPASAPEQKPEGATAQFDFQAVASEFMEKGALSEETYASLEKQGISKALADSFIAGQQAAATTRATEVFAVAGGKDSYQKMVEWGSANLAAEEVDLFNQALGGSPAAAKMAVSGLRQRYEAALGKTPDLLGGNQGAASAGYESAAQMKADMKNPLYKSDPAFRARVTARLAQTTAF